MEKHIIGKKNIARFFGVSTKTVKQWIVEDAPIIWVGRKYQTNYDALFLWLDKNKKRK